MRTTLFQSSTYPRLAFIEITSWCQKYLVMLSWEMSEPVREAYSVVNGWTRGMSSIYLLISRHKKKIRKAQQRESTTVDSWRAECLSLFLVEFFLHYICTLLSLVTELFYFLSYYSGDQVSVGSTEATSAITNSTSGESQTCSLEQKV